ncbi:MAG: substrate-binding domain-containing protein, partial [Planctomycetota bacterium]
MGPPPCGSGCIQYPIARRQEMDELRCCGLFLLVVLGIAAMAAGRCAHAESQEAPAAGIIRDKTLVAWTAPANLTQRGGSALTLEDGEDRFDAIVFGELAAGKWMAGSDFFKRTHKEQDGWPSETADAKTVVQMAIVYKGNEVTIYRDGKVYAAYRIDKPQDFGAGSFAVLGVRHVAAGNDCWFAGAIQDARIYDVPLTAEQLGALKPSQPSDPRPLAWWNFSGGKAEDVMGRFPNTKLFGKAKVADGLLHLDGPGSYLVSGRGELRSWSGEQASATPRNAGGDPIADTRALRDILLADPYRPAYHFVMDNHVTTNSFFTATIYGCEDFCALTGCTFTWTGSQTSVVGQMVSAMQDAIASKANGIGVPIIDNTAFNAPTNAALNAGIPVIAYNADVSPGFVNNRMAYVGQSNLTAGAAVANAVLAHGVPHLVKGDLVAGIIATPGTLNIQPRIDGAKPVFAAAGIDFVEVGTSPTEGAPEYNAIASWYSGHRGVKFMMTVD